MPHAPYRPRLTPHPIWGAALALALSACGGGMSADDDDPPPARGTVLSAQLAATVPAAQIDAGTEASGLQALSGKAVCDVDVRYVLYMTRDPAGQPATASAGVLVPKGSAAACSERRPVLLYAHGTAIAKSTNMADVVNNPEAALQMAMYAAQGFIVVMPNYLGYDRSSLDYHPYLNAEAQAIDMIDGLRAAKAHLEAQSAVKPSAKLLVSGYSQGGHVAVATQRALERDHAADLPLTAGSGMSGPYHLSKFVDVVMGPGPINGGATLFGPLLVTSFQRSYGNLYKSPAEIYQAPFDTTAPTLFPTDTPVATLLSTGKLPADPTFTKLFGPGGLYTDSFRAAYPQSALRTAAVKNTLVGSAFKRPLALCGGAQDPTVFFFNTTDLQADLAARGTPVPAFDLENRATLPPGLAGDMMYGGFQLAKAKAGANAQANYHGGLVPPFCSALVRGYFQQVLAAGQ